MCLEFIVLYKFVKTKILPWFCFRTVWVLVFVVGHPIPPQVEIEPWGLVHAGKHSTAELKTLLTTQCAMFL